MGSKELGDLAEEYAARSLVLRGYRIIERNFRIRSGEIDIIAMDGDTLVFVEVRSRTDEEYGLPYETINRLKQGKVKRTALAYMAWKGLLDSDSRFDCVSVVFRPYGELKAIEIIKDAYWS